MGVPITRIVHIKDSDEKLFLEQGNPLVNVPQNGSVFPVLK